VPIAAADAALDQAQVAADVQQGQVIERHGGALGERGQFGSHVLAQGPECLLVGAAHHDPAQAAEPVLVQ
jgi:hypothetical protein